MSGSVRAVYVVLSHRGWAQVRRLADAILRSSPEARVLIAHDARNERFPVDAGDSRIEVFTHGLACDWGSWELVEATLLAFARARETWDPQLVALISGQDYPMRRLEDWEDEALAAQSWIGESKALSYQAHWGTRYGEGDDRLTRYTYRWFHAPFQRFARQTPEWLSRFAARARNALALRLEPAFSVRRVTRGRGRYYGIRRVRAPFTDVHPCYFGAQWVAVRRAELDALLDQDLTRGSQLWRLYRRSVIPDESALVTPLSWGADPSPLPPVTRQLWDVAADRSVTWTLDDLESLQQTGSPFCRKVDPELSASLMDALDRRIS